MHPKLRDALLFLALLVAVAAVIVCLADDQTMPIDDMPVSPDQQLGDGR